MQKVVAPCAVMEADGLATEVMCLTIDLTLQPDAAVMVT